MRLRVEVMCIFPGFPGLNGVYLPNIIKGRGARLHPLKACVRRRGLAPFIISAQNGDEGSAVRPGLSTPGEVTPCTH